MTKEKTSGMDMLSGSMMGKILKFALPLALGSILQQLFNSVDVAVVGRFSSKQALAAVGANAPVVALLVNVFAGISVGSNVVIANYIGRGHPERVKNTVSTSIAVALTSGLILTGLGLSVAKLLLELMSTPEDVIGLAVFYLRIYCLGMPFIMLYNFEAAILRSTGDTKRPLFCLIISGVINAVLNVFFVVGFGLGVAGVAIATVISNIVSSGLLLCFLMKSEEPMKLELRDIHIYKEELTKILRIGVPAGLQGMVFSVANICIQAAINSFGSEVVAGSAVALNFEYLSYFLISGFNSAVMTFTSQNYGAGNLKRCRRAYFICMGCGILSCIVLNSGFYLGRDLFILFFTTDPVVAGYAAQRMKYVLLLQFLAGTYEISGSALRGFGHSMTPTLLTVFGTCIVRIVWINTVTVKHHTFFALMMVYPFSWVITGSIVVAAYFIVLKRNFAVSKGRTQ